MTFTSRPRICLKETPGFCCGGFHLFGWEISCFWLCPPHMQKACSCDGIACCVVGSHPPGRWFDPDWRMITLANVQDGLCYTGDELSQWLVKNFHGEKFLCIQRLLALLIGWTLGVLTSWMSTPLGNLLGMLPVVSVNSCSTASAFLQIQEVVFPETRSGKVVSPLMNFMFFQTLCEMGSI